MPNHCDDDDAVITVTCVYSIIIIPTIANGMIPGDLVLIYVLPVCYYYVPFIIVPYYSSAIIIPDTKWWWVLILWYSIMYSCIACVCWTIPYQMYIIYDNCVFPFPTIPYPVFVFLCKPLFIIILLLVTLMEGKGRRKERKGRKEKEKEGGDGK